MDPLEQLGPAAWQPTNVTRGTVLAFSASGANCVALIEADGAHLVLHSDDDGASWSAPWPEIPENLLVTALLAGSEAVHVSLLGEGVLGACYFQAGIYSGWEDAGVGLPRSAVVTSMAEANHVLYAGTQRHGIFTRVISGRAATCWNAMGSDGEAYDARAAVTSLVAVGGRLMGASAQGLLLIDEEGGRVASDSNAPAAPIGLAGTEDNGLMAWSPRGVWFSEDGGVFWVGLPDPPRKAIVRSTATAGPIVLAVMQTPHDRSINRWCYGAEAWTPFNDGLPQTASPSAVVATATSVLLGTGDRGIYRLQVYSHESVIPSSALTLQDEQTLQAGTTVRLTMHQSEDVRIELYGPGGECVRKADLKGLQAGFHEVAIADDSIVPGIYTFTIRAQGVTRAGRRLILR